MQKIILILHLLLLSLPASLQLTNQDAHIVMNADTYLTLGGSFRNNGTFNQSAGTVKFTGPNSSISGTIVPFFYKMEISMPAFYAVYLNTDINVGNAIQFVSGLINLNARNITLSPTALLKGEHENSRITGPAGGVVQITVPLNAPSNVNPGNLGAALTHTINFGNTTIKRGHLSHPAGPSGRSIFRYFQITPTSGSLSGARLRINYFNAELNGIHPNCLAFYRSVNKSSWSPLVPVIKDPSLKYVERSMITSEPYWTLSYYETGGPAPCSVIGRAAPLLADESKTGNDFIKRIYPTAGVKNAFFIETGNLPVQNMQVVFYDAQGHLLLNKQIAYRSQWLSIPAVAAGVYQVKVLSAEHIWQGKFIKE